MQAELAYAYAKAMGITRNIFIGRRIYELKKINSLVDLERLLFPGHYTRQLPNESFLVELESRITKRSAKNILSVVNSFSKPPQVLVQQLRSREYPENIKDASEDILYYKLLLKNLDTLPSDDRINIGKIIAEEISLRNCVIALRMRVFYNKTPDEIMAYLINLKMTIDNKDHDLSEDARKILYVSLNSFSDFNAWRWKKLINHDYDGRSWKIDPRHFQNMASYYIYRMTYRYFRQKPLSVCSVFCFIKLNQFEQDILTSFAEGFWLGMTSREVFNLLEVSNDSAP